MRVPTLLHDLASPCHIVWEFFGRIQAGGSGTQEQLHRAAVLLRTRPWGRLHASVQSSCWYEFLFYQETAELMWSEGGQRAVNERWLFTVTHMHNAQSFLTFTPTLKHKITSELFTGRCHGKELSILNYFFLLELEGILLTVLTSQLVRGDSKCLFFNLSL